MIKSIRKPGRQREWEQQLFPNSEPIELWRNILNANSLRLTVAGYNIATKISKKSSYSFKLEGITNRMLLQLDHLLQSPYYIKHRNLIYLLGEQDAIMLQLHGNNLKQYLENLSNE